MAKLYSSSWKTHLRATKHHLPYGITECCLPPDRWMCPTIPPTTITPARQAGTRFTYPGKIEDCVDLAVGYIPGWTVTHLDNRKLTGSGTNNLTIASPTSDHNIIKPLWGTNVFTKTLFSDVCFWNLSHNNNNNNNKYYYTGTTTTRDNKMSLVNSWSKCLVLKATDNVIRPPGFEHLGRSGFLQVFCSKIPWLFPDLSKVVALGSWWKMWW